MVDLSLSFAPAVVCGVPWGPSQLDFLELPQGTFDQADGFTSVLYDDLVLTNDVLPAEAPGLG